MRIFFSVGEPSGDLHGANLIKDLRSRNSQIEAVGFGGPKMADAGCDLLFDLTSLAVMGLWNVLINIRKFFALLDDADQYFAKNKIDAVVLIDYPGFNWWIARKAKKHGVTVFYYGVPQMWAWAPWRVKKLRKLVDHVVCKLPFEVPWFERRGCKATYVGHPYFDELVRNEADTQFTQSQNTEQKRLVLLPGSRTQEVRRNTQWMLEAAAEVTKSHPDLKVSIACFREAHATWIGEQLSELPIKVELHTGKTPELITTADVCMACSGSVSLELLHHRKPTVIVYRVSAIVMLLQNFMLRTRFITLVNMLASDRIEKSETPKYDPNNFENDVPMPEYLRWRNCSSEIAAWVTRWLGDESVYRAKVQQLEQLASLYALPGASERAAEFVLNKLTAEGVDSTNHIDSKNAVQDSLFANESTKVNQKAA